MKGRVLRDVAAVSETLLTAALAFLLLVYGGVKVIGRQFRVRQYMLDMPAGDLEGGQLVWIMHGFSRVYEAALGLAECAAALILLWPRTRTLGALACSAIMANIALLNIEYGIGALSSAAPMLAAAVLIGLLRLARRPTPGSTSTPRRLRIANAALLGGAAAAALLVTVLMVRAVEAMSDAFPIAGRYRIIGVESGDAAQAPRLLAEGAVLYLEFNGEAALRAGGAWWFGEYALQDRRVEARLYPLARGDSPAPDQPIELRGDWTTDAGTPRFVGTSPPIVLTLRRENREWPRR